MVPIMKKKATTLQQQLFQCALEGDVAGMERLIDLGADVHGSAWGGLGGWGSPLEGAICGRQMASLEFLVSRGLELDENHTFLWAAWEAWQELVEVMLARGADINAKDARGKTALSCAASGHEEFSPEEGERYCKFVAFLLASGADPAEPAEDGTTPLHIAAECGQYKVAEAFLSAGVDVDATTKEFRQTPLHLAAYGHGAGRGDPDEIERQSRVISVLLEHGANIHARDHAEQTPLHVAAMENQPGAVATLLKAGADVEALDDFDYTPLGLAACGRSAKAAQVLLEAGADIHTRNQRGDGVLVCAAAHASCQRKADLSTLRVLLDAGADINETCPPAGGCSALHVAAYYGSLEVVRFLVEMGACVEHRDKRGRIAQSIAAKEGHDRVTAFLSKQMGDKIHREIAAENWARARELIRSALRRERDSHRLLSRLGRTYYEERDYRRALHYSEKALSLAPRCPLVLCDYARCLDMLERPKEALSVYRRIVRRGVDRLAHGDCGGGLAWARSLVADCHYRMAHCYRKIRQRKRAIREYEAHLAMRGPGCHSIYPIKMVRRDLQDLRQATVQ